ncbi:MAG: LacI family DNA-binding transcriptional regulator [Puniceicoccaceae bacterium]
MFKDSIPLPPAPRAVRLRDVAEHAGVSLPTVCQILNPTSKRAGLFAIETQKKVRASARELGYRPNMAARSMAQRRFGNLSLILSRHENRSILPTGLLAGIDHALADAGMHLMVSHLTDSRLTDEGEVPDLLNQLVSDGLLMNYNAHIPRAMIKLIDRFQLPTIWINSKQAKDCTFPDDENGAYALTQLALKRGHRRIAFVNYTTGRNPKSCHYSIIDRQRGFERAMGEAGLKGRIISEQTELNPAERLKNVHAWLKEPERPDAVICYGQNEFQPIFAAMDQMGLTHPSDLGIFGIHDRPINHCGTIVPTAILPEFEMGQRAVNMMLDKLRNSSGPLPPAPIPLKIHPAS